MSTTSSRTAITPRTPTLRVLGIGVDMVQIPDVVSMMDSWVRERGPAKFIAVTGMHGVMEAHDDRSFAEVLKSADLVVPDGMPLVWLGRLRGNPVRSRVYGPELMAVFCEQTAHKKYRHFFYGGAVGVPERLAESFARRFPGLQVAGTYSPPFRSLTDEERARVIAQINASESDILWVGLSTPKQERWMYDHRKLLNVPVLVGVGAAFDFHTHRVRQAPRWVQENGLEWAFRLCQEPRRLCRRYLVKGPRFAALVLLELVRLRRFD